MTSPFMRAYALLLLKTCHKRGAPAIGGMSALIPIKNDPEKNAIAMQGIINDKKRDATDGYDGGWVAHPGLVEPAMKEFLAVLGDKPNQWEKQRDDVEVTAGATAGLPARDAHHRGRPALQHQRRHPLPRRLAGRQRLRADPQPDGRRGHRRDQPLAGLAMDPQPEGRARRRPQGDRRRWCARWWPRSSPRSRRRRPSASSTARRRSSRR